MQAVVVTLEHLAVAALGCYGNALAQTPHFDRLAAGSVVFDQCYGTADPGASIPGIADVANVLGAEGGNVCVADVRVTDGPIDETSRRAIADWRAAAATARTSLLWLKCPAIATPWQADWPRFAESWQRFDELHTLTGILSRWLTEDDATPVDRSDAPALTNEAAIARFIERGVFQRDMLAENPQIGRVRRAMYAAVVQRLDAGLGELLKLLDGSPAIDSLFIVTAAAGDLTGPHPELASGCPRLIDPLLRVPLLVRTGTPVDGTRRGALVSTADLAATLAQWFNLDCRNTEGDGRSLIPLLRDEMSDVRNELLIGASDAGWRLQTSEFACVCGQAALDSAPNELAATAAGRPRLFLKPDDVREVLDVAREHPDRTDDMVRRIRELARATPPAAGPHHEQ